MKGGFNLGASYSVTAQNTSGVVMSYSTAEGNRESFGFASSEHRGEKWFNNVGVCVRFAKLSHTNTSKT